MIRLQNLSLERGGRVICQVNELNIQRGERVGIVGPNGSGKTTLLRILAGLIDDHEGSCQVDVPLRQRIYLHQEPYLFRGTVRSNVMYGMRGTANGAARAEEWMKRVGLAGLAERSVDDLSGGERKRVALARLLVLEPALLLLDEPLSDLDPKGINGLHEGLDSLRECTVVLTAPRPLTELGIQRSFRLGDGPA